MKPSSQKYAEWEQNIGRVKTGMTKAEVEAILGRASSLVDAAEREILAYRAEQIGDAIYSIRVVYDNGLVAQCYMGVEPCAPEPQAKSSRAARYFQLFLIVVLGALAAFVYAWFAAR